MGLSCRFPLNQSIDYGYSATLHRQIIGCDLRPGLLTIAGVGFLAGGALTIGAPAWPPWEKGPMGSWGGKNIGKNMRK